MRRKKPKAGGRQQVSGAAAAAFIDGKDEGANRSHGEQSGGRSEGGYKGQKQEVQGENTSRRRIAGP